MQQLTQKEKLSLCIQTELQAHQKSKYDTASCPLLWMRIFMRFYAEVPPNTEDPRWDEILHKLEGLRQLNTLLGKEKYWEKERAAF